MRSDADIERDVTEELKWDPDLDATDISVKVDHEVIILTGFAMSFTDKYEAEIAAKRVVGIVAVANDIEVHFPRSIKGLIRTLRAMPSPPSRANCRSRRKT